MSDWDAMQRQETWDELQRVKAELQRYREREPLVEQLATFAWCFPTEYETQDANEMQKNIEALQLFAGRVKNFKVNG